VPPRTASRRSAKRTRSAAEPQEVFNKRRVETPGAFSFRLRKFLTFTGNRTIYLLVVSIEGASRGVRVAGNGRRLRSWFAATIWGGFGSPSAATTSRCLGWLEWRTPVRRKKRLRLKISASKGLRGLRKKSAGSRKRGPGALWEERRSRALRDDRFLERGAANEDRCVSQRSLPSTFSRVKRAGCIGVRACRQINPLFENRIRTSKLWSQETRTMRLPRLSPLRRPISAFGVFSMPSSTSSCTFSLPDATQPCSSATAFIA
jgi:hypothetical protein